MGQNPDAGLNVTIARGRTGFDRKPELARTPQGFLVRSGSSLRPTVLSA
jgi:hypothetical protein